MVGLEEWEREREKVGKIGDFYTRRSDQEGGSKDIFLEADLGGNGLYDTLFLGCTQLRLRLVLGLGEKGDFRGMSSCQRSKAKVRVTMVISRNVEELSVKQG